jgi:hypothetical protein
MSLTATSAMMTVTGKDSGVVERTGGSLVSKYLLWAEGVLHQYCRAMIYQSQSDMNRRSRLQSLDQVLHDRDN